MLWDGLYIAVKTESVQGWIQLQQYVFQILLTYPVVPHVAMI